MMVTLPHLHHATIFQPCSRHGSHGSRNYPIIMLFMHRNPNSPFGPMHRHPAAVHLGAYFGEFKVERIALHMEQGTGPTACACAGSKVQSARFLSSVSTKRCLDATKARSWITWISENQQRHKYINTKIHKYLDHCTCNEHEEKNTLGLHGAVNRLLLPVQLENYGAIKIRLRLMAHTYVPILA